MGSQENSQNPLLPSSPEVIRRSAKKAGSSVSPKAKSIKRVASENPSKCEKKRKRDVGTALKRILASSPQALRKAKEIQAKLSPGPSFIKTMQRSHVTSTFYMCPPMRFCKDHLPRDKDQMIFLEVENGQAHEIKYLPKGMAFSGGWRGFSIAKELREGDVLVFHLIDLVPNCIFQVYIVRAKYVASPNKSSPGKNKLDKEGTSKNAKKRPRGLPLTLFDMPKKGKKDSLPADSEAEDDNIDSEAQRSSNSQNTLTPSQDSVSAQNNMDSSPLVPYDSGSDDRSQNLLDNNAFLPNLTENPEKKRPRLEDISMVTNSSLGSESIDVKSPEFSLEFDKFKIIVNGSAIDSELPGQIRNKYFNLCCSRKSLLHRKLLNSIDTKFAINIISRIVEISESIQGCKLWTKDEDFKNWKGLLQGFESFGMEVGFLLARLNRLSAYVLELKKRLDCKKFKRAEVENERVDKEIERLKSKLLELEKEKRRCVETKEALSRDAKKFEGWIEEEAMAPWGSQSFAN